MLSELGHPAVMQVTFDVVLLKLALRRCGHFVGLPGEGSSFVDNRRSSPLSVVYVAMLFVNISTAVCSCHSRYVC